jgi:hypothetical protein
MKKELSDDYEISGLNILDIEIGINNFKVKDSEFFIYPKGKVNRKILAFDNMQIFKMNDGIFILEVEDYQEGTVEYFYSEDIYDLA